MDTQAQIDQVLQLAERPLWIVTASFQGRQSGLVASWVLPASLDPPVPVVVAGLAPNHFTSELVAGAGALGLHLISADQADLVWRFAGSSGRRQDKLAGLEWRPGRRGVPLLAQCLARLECRVIHRMDSGDRWFFWADVEGGELVGSGRPLTDREALARCTAAQRAQLAADVQSDLAIQRRWRDSWRASLGLPRLA